MSVVGSLILSASLEGKVVQSLCFLWSMSRARRFPKSMLLFFCFSISLILSFSNGDARADSIGVLAPYADAEYAPNATTSQILQPSQAVPGSGSNLRVLDQEGPLLESLSVPRDPSHLKLIPLRVEASYSVGAADVEVPYWKSVGRDFVPAQKSSTAGLTESRLSGSLAWRVTAAQSMRIGLSFVRFRSGVPAVAASLLGEGSEPTVWRGWGAGMNLSIVRHMFPWMDVDGGLGFDYIAAGVANLGGGVQSSGGLRNLPPDRVDLSSGWQAGWQAGIGGIYLGPFGIVLRIGGHLGSLSFSQHSKPMETQSLMFSVGSCVEFGRGDP